MDPRELRRLYNHPKWPSPYAKLVVIKKNLDKDEDGNKIKRITHEQALTILSKKFRKTIPEFLELQKEDVWLKLGSYRNSFHTGQSIPVCPLKLYNKYYPYHHYY
jgi:hypothetical protein